MTKKGKGSESELQSIIVMYSKVYTLNLIWMLKIIYFKLLIMYIKVLYF